MSDHEHTDNKNMWNTRSPTSSNFTTPYRIGQNSSLSESGSLKVILDVEGQPEEREREGKTAVGPGNAIFVALDLGLE